jgi:hypothetical protein
MMLKDQEANHYRISNGSTIYKGACSVKNNNKRSRSLTTLASIALLGMSGWSANAATIDLFEYGFNIDLALTESAFGDPTPSNVDASGFSFSDGLGQIDITLTGAGAHNALVYFDHEIDEAINTYFNENATSGGSLASGQKFEADEPGFIFGDIYDNFLANSLDNTNGVTIGSEDDVSMAISWDFVLAAGQTAVASFFTNVVNGAGSNFWLSQNDPDSNASFFFWSTLTITDAPIDPPIDPPIGMPEPSMLVLMTFGMLAVFGLRRRRSH